MRADPDLFGMAPAAPLPMHVTGFLPHIAGMEALPSTPLPIADMADIFGVTHRTLHFYEEKNLLSPMRSGAMRIYDMACILRMLVITTCREIGMSLVAIKELMERLTESRTQEEADTLFRTALSNRRSEMVSEVSLITRQVEKIRTLLAGSGRKGTVMIEGSEAPARLSDLEKRCLGLMAEGYKGAALALALGLCSGELTRLEAAIIVKLDAANRYQAAAKAILGGMLPN